MSDNTIPEWGDTPIQEAALVTMEYLTRLSVRPTAVPDEREAAALKVVAEYAYEHPRFLLWYARWFAACEQEAYERIKAHIEGRDTRPKGNSISKL